MKQLNVKLGGHSRTIYSNILHSCSGVDWFVCSVKKNTQTLSIYLKKQKKPITWCYIKKTLMITSPQELKYKSMKLENKSIKKY